MIKAEEKQQKLLEDFFEEQTVWYPDHVLQKFLAWILLGISMGIWIVPYQVWAFPEHSFLFTMYGLGIMGLSFYMQRFNTYKEENKMKVVGELLKYLPVSNRQICIFRIRKMKKICIRLTGISAVCQTVFSIAFMHTFSVYNIIFPIAGGYVLPVLFCCLGFLKRSEY